MRILNSYIARDNLLIIGVSLAIFQFVMAVSNIFRVIDLISRGVSARLILKVFSYGMPFYLIFAVPMSVLAAAFLQFSRMTDDREVAAMKASGISIWQIIKAPVIIAIILSALCLYVNCSLAPKSHYARRRIVGQLGIETPLSLIDAGIFIREFPGWSLYVGAKYYNKIGDVIVHQFGEDGLEQVIYAKSGDIQMSQDDPQKMIIRLKDWYGEKVESKKSDGEDLGERSSDVMRFPKGQKRLSYTLDVLQLGLNRTIWKKRADFTMSEVFNSIRGKPLFLPGDFLDAAALIDRLKNPNDRAGSVIRGLLSHSTSRRLDAYDASGAQIEQLQDLLFQEFNRIIEIESFSLKLAEAGLVDERTIQLASFTALPHGEKVRRNRELLEKLFSKELIQSHLLPSRHGEQESFRMSMLVEAATRIVLSVSCFAFVIFGAALGMKIHRKESSIGAAVTLTMTFFFYFFIIVADSLVSRPEFQPHLIVLFPFLISTGLGYHLLRRAA